MERQKMTNFQIAIIIVAIGLGLGVIATLDDSDVQKEQMQQQEEQQKQEEQEKQEEQIQMETHDYPDNVRSNFMEHCTVQPGMEDYCECSLDIIEEEYTLKEFYKMEFEMDDNQEEMPEEIMDIALECVHLIEY